MSFSTFPFSVDLQRPAIFEIGGFSHDQTPEWLSAWRQDFPEWIVLPRADGGALHRWFDDLEAALTTLTVPAILLCRGDACADLALWLDGRPMEALRHIEGGLFISPSLSSPRGILAILGGQGRSRLLFPSVVIGSRNSLLSSYEEMQQAAQDWGSRLVDGGDIGDGAEPVRLRDWPHGRHVLDWLVEQAEERQTLRQSCSILSAGLHAKKSNPNKF